MQLPAGVESHLLGLDSVASHGSPADASRALGIALPDALRKAVSKRQYEYLGGRACAVQALRAAGWRGEESIGTQAGGAPAWPDGYTGSIAHGAGFAWAVAAARREGLGLGIDIESIMTDTLALELRGQILAPAELFPARAAGADFATYLTLVFSAKESLYKCLQPLSGVELDFPDAECVGLDAGRRHLDFRLCRDVDARFHAGFELRALLELRADCVMTAVMVGGTGIEPVASTV